MLQKTGLGYYFVARDGIGWEANKNKPVTDYYRWDGRDFPLLSLIVGLDFDSSRLVYWSVRAALLGVLSVSFGWCWDGLVGLRSSRSSYRSFSFSLISFSVCLSEPWRTGRFGNFPRGFFFLLNN